MCVCVCVCVRETLLHRCPPVSASAADERHHQDSRRHGTEDRQRDQRGVADAHRGQGTAWRERGDRCQQTAVWDSGTV